MLFVHEVLQQVHEITLHVVVSAIVVSAVGRLLVEEVAELGKPRKKKKRK